MHLSDRYIGTEIENEKDEHYSTVSNRNRGFNSHQSESVKRLEIILQQIEET